MTKKQLIATKMDIPKTKLKNTIPCGDEVVSNLTNQICEEALNNLISSLKELDENAPYEALRAFAITYFDLEITHEYNVKTMEYQLFCTPKWKGGNKIDTKSKEFKLLEEYCWNGV